MEIEVDYNPPPKRIFFISIALNKNECISFDYTTKAHRITKQVLIEKKKFPKNKKIDGEWDAIVLKGGKFIKRYHVRWIDLERKDWVNNEIWETRWEKSLPIKTAKRLMEYSRFISDNYKKLKKEEIKDFEDFLAKEIKRLK